MATLQIRHFTFAIGIICAIVGITLMESVSTRFRLLYFVGALTASFSFYVILHKDKKPTFKILAFVLFVATVIFGTFI